MADMIQKSHLSSLLEDSLASNIPLVTKPDTDDDRLAQLFMVLHRTPAKEQEEFIKQVLNQWGVDSGSSKLPQILLDQDLRKVAMYFTSMKHFRSSNAGTGLTCRQLLSWQPVTAGVSDDSYYVYKNAKSNQFTDPATSGRLHVTCFTLSSFSVHSQCYQEYRNHS